MIVYKCIEYEGKYIFTDFVRDIYEKRLEMKKSGTRSDLVLFYKLILNSLYGKFG
jgi:hypothetical protein